MENSPKFLGDPGMKFLGQNTYTVPAELFVVVAVVTAVGAAVVVTATVVVAVVGTVTTVATAVHASKEI